MSLIPGGPHLIIQGQYNGEPLNLIPQDSVLNWNQHPLRISEAQLETIDMPSVMKVLQKTLQSPSELAGFDVSQIKEEVILLIDKEFREAMLRYEQTLIDVSAKDLTKIRALEVSHRHHPGAGAGIGAGGGALAGAGIGAIAGPAGAAIGGVIGAILGSILLFFGVKQGVSIHVNHSGSAHRIKWLIQVDGDESKRLQRAKNLLINRAILLSSELKRLEEAGEKCEFRKEKILQLHKVFKALFPQENILVDGQPLQLPAIEGAH